MNKVTKGTLAAAAAGALLLGGAGTYATWSDSATLNAGGVSTGQLTLSDAETAGWEYEGREGVVASPVIVPGDILSAVYEVTINAAGDNIQGTLGLTGLEEDSANEITVDYNVAPDPDDETPLHTIVEGATYSFAKAGVYKLLVTVTINYVDTPNQSSEGAAADLNISELDLTLTQTLKPKTA